MILEFNNNKQNISNYKYLNKINHRKKKKKKRRVCLLS